MRKKELLNSKIKDKLFFYSIVILPCIQILIFYVYVNFQSVALAFEEYNGVTMEYQFAGFRTFRRVFEYLRTPRFLTQLGNTFWIWLFISFVPLIINVPVGIYLFKRFKGATFFRYMIVLPTLIPGLVSSVIMKNMVDVAIPELVFKLFGMKIDGLLVSPNTIYPTLVVLHFISTIGAGCLVYIGCLCNVNVSHIEAARLDGANSYQEMWNVYIPSLWPILSLSIALTPTYFWGADLGLYAYFTENADPEVWTIGYYTYTTLLYASESTYPYLSAIGFLQTLIIIPIAISLRKIMEKVGPNDD